MLNICYSEDGKAYSDFNLIEDAQKIINQYTRGESSVRNVSTGNIIQALRVLVVRGKLSHEKICFVFNDKTITLNDKVEFSIIPIGFIDWEDDFLFELRKKRL